MKLYKYKREYIKKKYCNIYFINIKKGKWEKRSLMKKNAG